VRSEKKTQQNESFTSKSTENETHLHWGKTHTHTHTDNIPLLKKLLHLLANRETLALLEVAVSAGLLGKDRTEILNLEAVTSRHDVRVVHGLDERLDAAALAHLAGAHGLGDLERVAVHTSNDGVRVVASVGTLIKVLQDNRLAAGVATREQDNNLARLQKLLLLHFV